MRVEDKIQDIFDIDTQFSIVGDSLVANVEVSFDNIIRVIFETSYLHNRIYKYSTNEVRFVFSWCDKNWQEYLIKVKELDTGVSIHITQATRYKVEGGVIINE